MVSVLNPLVGHSRNPVRSKLPFPHINGDSWVMIEIWPEVKDITFSAYFLDFSYEKNKNLCRAAVLVFDRDQIAQSEKMGKTFTSHRECLSVNDAFIQGYIRRE